MLHLAQVQNNENVGGVRLRLLARQQSDNCWAVINPESVILTNTNSLNESYLVLVELSENQEVLSIQPAKDWVLDFIRDYLTLGITPSFLIGEQKRAEEWRQDLTLQSQDLTRQRAEMEARRDTIQALEAQLGPQQRQLMQQIEEMREQLRVKDEELERANQQLTEMAHIREKLRIKDEQLQEVNQQLQEMTEKLNSQETQLKELKQHVEEK